MLFRDIPGQNNIAELLRKTVQENRVSHAQLFSGTEGSATLPLALAYAQYITCTERTADDACGKCPSCVKHSRLIHPDLHFVFPVFRTKKFPEPVCDNFLPEWRAINLATPFFGISDWIEALEVENAQTIIYAAEASEIIRKLSLKTYEAEYKTMIIWLPEKMHHAAANKLLKLIEEPPDRTLFLLVSEEPDRILPTILSRCQMIKFRGADPGAIAGYIAAAFPVGAARANEIAHVSDGNLVRAIKLASGREEEKENLNNFRLLMRHAWKRDIPALIDWSENIASTGRESQKDFLGYCLELVRGNFIMNRSDKHSLLTSMTEAETKFSSSFNPFVNERNIEKLNHEFNTAFYHIESNGNARMIFLDLALQVTMVIRS
ncbi:MAG: DNA polymerase III subunit delta [Bacteroidales bacterium]|jgi:DNA polymerase-3 subunit delta'|nr:DNA polymerase III subunit delta [Bacteroidales bacterium]